MAWPNSQAAISALRNILLDGPKDKICANKKVLGICDGVNTVFKTFEYRRITDFTNPVFPEGIYQSGQPIDSGLVDSDDLASGIFVVNGSAIPDNRITMTATYYYQWFTDAELDSFLQNASTWLGFSTTYINTPDGLNPALLRFACQEAYESAAMKYSTRAAEVYQLEDAPKEDILKAIEAFQKMADNFLSKAEQMRDDFYTRQGQSLAPNFAFSLGKVTDPTPRR